MTISVFDAQANAGGVNDVEPVDLLQSRVEIGLDGEVGHDDQRDGTLVGCIVAGVVLDEAGDTDTSFTENLG